MTSKQVVKHGIKVTQGTVYVGKRITKTIAHGTKYSTGRHRTINEPSPNKKRRRKSDQYFAVDKVMSGSGSTGGGGTHRDGTAGGTGSVPAGQLSAPDQSLRMVSHFLSTDSTSTSTSSERSLDGDLLASRLAAPAALAAWFFKGDAAALGGAPARTDCVEKCDHFWRWVH